MKALPKFETRSPGGWIGVAAVVAFPFPPPLFPPLEKSRESRGEGIEIDEYFSSSSSFSPLNAFL